MIALILAQLRRRRGRAFALAAGILVAATSFSLLTSAVSTSRAETVGTVSSNARSAYDLLVRPPGTQTALERQRGLVESDFLSGIFGGITMDQYHRIAALAGVDTAAPVANLGYLLVNSHLRLDLTGLLAPGVRNQLLRVRPVLTAGPNRFALADQYVYVTSDPITTVDTTPMGGLDRVQTQHTPTGARSVCWYFDEDPAGVATKGPFGQWDPSAQIPGGASPFTAPTRTMLSCESAGGRTYVDLPVSFPVMLSAVDPVAESRLVGLDRAVTFGRMLRESDRPGAPTSGNLPTVKVPVLLSSTARSAGAVSATVQRLDTGDPATLPDRLAAPGARAFVNGLGGSSAGTVRADLDDAYRTLDTAAMYSSGTYWTVGPVRYRAAGNALEAAPRPAQPLDVWRGSAVQGWVRNVPEENTGTQFRTVTARPEQGCIGVNGECVSDGSLAPAPLLDFVGRYDATRLDRFAALSDVPLDTYQPPTVTGADAASRAALGGAPLLPDRNLGGFLSQPPTLLTTLDSVQAFLTSRSTHAPQDSAPISAIRIRVAGVHGVDAASRARVNAVAAAIRAAYPDLAVDVTVGSSPQPQTIALPGGLRVTEGWTEKGVALRVMSAVDTKSAVLFVLVLVVCALFLGQAALASVRARRTEIGTLRCVGWSAAEVFRLVLGELLLIGTAAGAAGALLAWLFAAGFGLQASAAKAALVLPTAVLLALAAGGLPAWRATRLGPLDAVRPPVVAVRRARPVRSVRGLALRNLLRVPGRSLLGASGLALGVAAFTVLLGVTLAFRGEVAGSLLGDAVVAQARAVDYASVALSLLLGAAGAVDVLVLAQRERAADLAVLRACGWSGRELFRLALTEGLWLSLFGGLLGAASGLGVLALLGQGLLDGGRTLGLVAAGLLATAVGVLLVCGTLTLPARALGRIAPARLLATDG